jgi:exonuclease SbcC
LALEALASYRQNGKIIGVISHVQALKERISNQLQVIPQAGGMSILSGPGCSLCRTDD